MKRGRNHIAPPAPPPAKRRRAAGEPEQTSHFEGTELVVTLGGEVVIRHTREGLGLLRATCFYPACGAQLLGSGAKLQAFYDEHYKLHTEAAPEIDVHRLGAIEDLIAEIRKLDGDELEVVKLVVDGLGVGRPQYGRLDVSTDQRDLELEAIHEGRDQVVYDAADLLRRVRRRARSS
jgi:hypothetical protein